MGSQKNVEPMLATLVAKPFDRPGWFFEVKWDGYRAIAEVSRLGVSLYSRKHTPFEKRFAPLTAELSKLGHEAAHERERERRTFHAAHFHADHTARGSFLHARYQKIFRGEDQAAFRPSELHQRARMVARAEAAAVNSDFAAR